jgi:hypothetical protein
MRVLREHAARRNRLDALRVRYGEALGARLPDHIQRLPWDAERLAGQKRERLRALLACAIERSPSRRPARAGSTR